MEQNLDITFKTLHFSTRVGSYFLQIISRFGTTYLGIDVPKEK